MTYSTSTYPYNCVVLIESLDPVNNNVVFSGSGVVIGPHTILTASHVVYDTADQVADNNLKIYTGWSNADPQTGPGYINTSYTDHYFQIGQYGSDSLYPYQSAQDYAIIDTSYTFSSWLGVTTDYGGGTVHLTGYAGYAGGYQTDQTGTVVRDASYNVLDYQTVTSYPGDSGGPLWYGGSSGAYVVGVVSTGTQACLITSADFSQIESWVSQDGYSLNYVAPTVTAVPSVTLSVGQSIAASTLFASISNPSGDSITQYIFLDKGGGTGYFTLNGVKQGDGAWIYPTGSDVVNYVAGPTAGTDTVQIGIYDYTTNSYSYSSNLTTITTLAKRAASDDFNGDGKSDLIWQDTAGDVAVWTSTGSNFTSTGYGNVGANTWYVQEAADFNGDGKSDILWRKNDGSVAVWTSTGSNFTGATYGVVDISWTVAGAADYNGDGKADILWRNSNGEVNIWNANGSGFAGQDFGNVSTDWRIQNVGAGDFNGDGKADILFRNTTTGDLDVWSSTGSNFTGHDYGSVDLSWKVAAVGDFNGDGKSDILWRNTSTGAVNVWTSTGSNFAGHDYGAVGLDWNIVQAADTNGDGYSDIVWRNNNGDLNIWSSSGANFTGQDYGVVGTNWYIMGK